MTSSQKRILVVDDHPIVRQGLAQFVNQEPDMAVCAEASSYTEAMDAIAETGPDLAVVDLELEGENGLDLVKDINETYPDLPVLVLSMHDERLYAERVLRAGARGYIMKQRRPNEVLTAIRRVLQGGIYVSDDVSTRILKLVSEGSSGSRSSPVDRLSDRELEVLQWIGRGYQTRHIAKQLSLSPKTIEAYKARIRQKLLLEDAAELSRYAAAWIHDKRSS